jgi:hypothetical protein
VGQQQTKRALLANVGFGSSSGPKATSPLPSATGQEPTITPQQKQAFLISSAISMSADWISVIVWSF